MTTITKTINFKSDSESNISNNNNNNDNNNQNNNNNNNKKFRKISNTFLIEFSRIFKYNFDRNNNKE